jgi:hypothetical protein
LKEKEPFSILRALNCRKYFFQKLPKSFEGNNVVDAANSHTDGLLSRDTCVSPIQQLAYLQQIETFSNLKNLSCRKYSFQNLSQFSQRNNFLDAAASNVGGFLWIDTCVSSTLLNKPVWSKETLSTPCKL